MAYHLDGTQIYRINSSNVVSPMSSQDIQKINNEAGREVGSEEVFVSPGFLVFIFPQLRDISTYIYIGTGYTSGTNSRRGRLQTSTNTTNGVDGTWTTVQDPFSSALEWGQYGGPGPIHPYDRTGFATVSAMNGIKAIRFESAQYSYGDSIGIGALHLFGNISSGQTPDRIELWHPTLNQKVSGEHFDFGDVTRSETKDITFRVKNISSTQTANNIVVSISNLTDLSPTAIGNYTLSLNGGSFASSQNISSLSAGSISSVLTLRLTNPSNAALSLWTGTVRALATSWT